MIGACLLLIGFDLLGEFIQKQLAIPFPGSLIGLFLLTGLLLIRPAIIRPRVQDFARFCTSQMALFFVPAGCGIIIKAGEIKSNWIPISAALIGSTVVSLFVTAWVMQILDTLMRRSHQTRIGSSH